MDDTNLLMVRSSFRFDMVLFDGYFASGQRDSSLRGGSSTILIVKWRVNLGVEREQRLGPRRALARFVAQHGLASGRVLEVGSGTCELQDVVRRRIGVDLAFSAGGLSAKPFAVAFAELLPFQKRPADGHSPSRRFPQRGPMRVPGIV
jgi:hypothetical protein